MTQYARPDEDLSLHVWTDHNALTDDIYEAIDDDPVNNLDFVIAENDMSSALPAKFGLSVITDPTPTTTGHIVTYRAKGYAAEGVLPELKVELYVGALTEIVSYTQTSLTTSFADYTITLTSEQVGFITDYTDLRLWITMLSPVDLMDSVSVAQLFFEAPDVPVVTTFANNASDSFHLVDHFGSNFSLE